MNKIEIYTDGSSLIKDKFYESSSGVLIYLNDEEVYRCGTYHVNGTNSLGELYAVYIGLCKMEEIIIHSKLEDVKVYLYCDSEYVVKSLTGYIKKWIKSGLDSIWYTQANEPVKYQSTFKEIYRNYLYKGNPYKVKFFHINSHLDSDKKIKKARFKFMEKNDCDISFDDFKKHASRNDIADEYAECIRKNKILFEERGSEECLNIRNILVLRGSMVVKRKIK